MKDIQYRIMIKMVSGRDIICRINREEINGIIIWDISMIFDAIKNGEMIDIRSDWIESRSPSWGAESIMKDSWVCLNGKEVESVIYETLELIQ